MLVLVLQSIVLIIDIYVDMCFVQQNFFNFVCLSILMHFTGAKFLSNDLKGIGDMAIFVLLCKITHSFMHANMQIIE